MGLAIARLSGARLVFHNEGFYPDEQVDAGIWREGSLPHRATRSFEQRLYAGADGIIALSERGRDAIQARLASPARDERVIVVPSCVDLETWPLRAHPRRSAGPPRLVYLGSVGARYGFGFAARFAQSVSALAGGVRLRILSPVDPGVVAGVLSEAGLSREEWSIASVPHLEVAHELAGQDCGLAFYAPGRATLGCSPTKVGEYWASGIPVATTPGIGDTEKVIRLERVGVIVDADTEESRRVAALELLTLLADPSTAQRCRKAAERHYSLEVATERQLQLYRQLVSD